MAKKKSDPATESTSEVVDATPSKPAASLALRLSAVTGMGVLVLDQRLAEYNNDAEIEALLADNDVPMILQRLSPSQKA